MLGNHEEALVCFETVLEKNPRSAPAWCGKGAALGNVGKHAEAVVCFDKALKINPHNVAAQYNKKISLHFLGGDNQNQPP